jgi:hypothetical protein
MIVLADSSLLARPFRGAWKNLPRGACASAEARSGAYGANSNVAVSKLKWKRPAVSGLFLISDERSHTIDVRMNVRERIR